MYLSSDVGMFNLVWTLRECIKGDCSCSVVSFWQLATMVVTIFLLICDTFMIASASLSTSVTTSSTKKRSSTQAVRPLSSSKVAKSSNVQSLKTQVLTIFWRWLADAYIGGSCYCYGGAAQDGGGVGDGGASWQFILLNQTLFIRTGLSIGPSVGCRWWWDCCFIQAATISRHCIHSESLGALCCNAKGYRRWSQRAES